MGLAHQQNNYKYTGDDVDANEAIRLLNTYIASKKHHENTSVQQQDQAILTDKCIDIAASLTPPRQHPKTAYADELERYPVVKD
jgi:hypothetical protein